MIRTIVARWQDWAGEGLQQLVLTEAPAQIVAEVSVIGAEEGERVAASFRIQCDGAWRTRRLQASVLGDERRIDLVGDGEGTWHDADGRTLSGLAGAIDVDLPLTPFTNTLPIRRLDLRAGQSADLRVVYVILPAFTVSVDPQRYTCLEPMRRYRYESLDSDFVREVEVDADGLVVTYPDLFRRVV
ncbi:putative glycolipid-binding domain-containing protein [Vineibacter terrae]|nr:putative glycolipid-binding domain-containing protein [Vineibacter terrae]